MTHKSSQVVVADRPTKDHPQMFRDLSPKHQREIRILLSGAVDPQNYRWFWSQGKWWSHNT
jgi:hypothetical protein